MCQPQPSTASLLQREVLCLFAMRVVQSKVRILTPPSLVKRGWIAWLPSWLLLGSVVGTPRSSF